MKRVIVNYNKLTEEILNLLVEKYPDGYNDSDIVSFRNLSGELVEAVEVRTEDTIYLIIVSVKLVQSMENFSDEEVAISEVKEMDFSEESEDDVDDEPEDPKEESNQLDLDNDDD